MKDNPTSGKSQSNWLVIVGTALMIIALVLIIWFFAHGQTTVTGSWTEAQTTESLVCNSDTFDYPFFTYDSSRNKNTRINAVFANDTLASISLVHMLYYNTTQQITDSDNLNHVDLNTSYGKNGLGADALNAKFTKTTDALQFSIYADANKINTSSAQYFMLDSLSGSKYTISAIEQVYKNKGFNCIVNK